MPVAAIATAILSHQIHRCHRMIQSGRSAILTLFWLAVAGMLILLIVRHTGHIQAAEGSAGGIKTTIPEMAAARQLIVVKTADWPSVEATIELFERADAGDWKRFAGPFPAVVGRSGIRWGIGLHGCAPRGAREKREGDGCAPAGVFDLDTVFGYAPANAAGFLKLPYTEVTDDLEGIDDPASRHYNRLVRRSSIAKPDWHSSEKMRGPGGLYRWGVVVRHNWRQQPGRGSCIFLHLWRGPGSGTSGCTAFTPETMGTLLHWLDRGGHPLLVQLPAEEYRRRRQAWHLP